MKLQTQIPLVKADHPIDYDSSLILLGSCFVENMGNKLGYYKFRFLQNPFGILFHPFAIENLVSRANRNAEYSEKEIFYYNEQWHCYDAHSILSDPSKETLLRNLNEGLQELKVHLENASHIIITLGTAWVYRKIAGKSIVANCHKMPQQEFSKEILSSSAVAKSIRNSIAKIRDLNSDVQIILTVSPVRHLKDGFVENQRSKAHLIAAIHDVLVNNVTQRTRQNEQPFVQAGIKYFPSYEILMDELRDYRFYDADMVHPNNLAVNYIWEKFKEVWISQDINKVMDRIDEIQKGLGHKAFNPDSEEHERFKKSLADKIMYLKQDYPFMEF